MRDIIQQYNQDIVPVPRHKGETLLTITAEPVRGHPCRAAFHVLVLFALFSSILLLAPFVSYAETPSFSSSELEGINTLKGAREKLFQMRGSSDLPGRHKEMMDLAKNSELEKRFRGEPLAKLMEDMPYKETGSPPAKSRGLMSDIDRALFSVDDFEVIKQRVKDLGYKDVEINKYRIKINELDTVIWKPGGKYSALMDKHTSFAERASILAKDPEFALEAGRGTGAHPFMSVVENLTKGEKPLMGDLSKLPPWEAELEIVAGAKDVLRSLKASGLCTGEMKSACSELEAIKSMEKPPGNLLEKQKDLRGLMEKAFEKSQKLLDLETETLVKRLQEAVDPDEIERLEKRVAELREQMTEGVERLKMLEGEHPHEIRQMTGGRSTKQIKHEMTGRGVKLEKERMRLEGDRALHERAAERAKKVERISYIVDVLQFVACVEEGKEVSTCFKEAVEGLIVGELLSDGVYCISLVSETGGLIASGALSVLGFGATMYFTGVQLGELAYEVIAWREARDEEDGIVARMIESQRARVQSLALQLERLEEKVKGFVTETAGLKEALLDDIDRYDRLSGIMKEAGSYRRQEETRLEGMLGSLAKAGPNCNEIQGTIESLKRTLEEASTRQLKVEKLLLEAQKLVKDCTVQDSVEKGNILYKEVQDLMTRNQDLSESLDLDRQNLHSALTAFGRELNDVSAEPAFGTGLSVSSDIDWGGNGSGEIPGKGNTLNKSLEILDTLKTYADEVEANLVDIVEVMERVRQTEEEIETKKEGFKGEFQNFKYAFPEDLTNEWVEKYGFPEEAAASWLRRLERLEMTVNDVKLMDDDTWRERIMELMAENDGLYADARIFILYVREVESRLDRIRGDIGDCLYGGDMEAAAEDLIDQIDTQKTLMELAFTKLGDGYIEMREACTQGAIAASAEAVADTEPEKDETFNPVHLFELVDNEEEHHTFYLLYVRAEPSHLDKTKFRFPDGNAGYYHYGGKDLGVYRDKASLCAVLRGKGIYSVMYNLAAWSVACNEEGPVAQASGMDAGETTPGKNNASTAGSQADVRIVAETVTGDVGYYVDQPRDLRPISRDEPIPSGATLQVGKSGSIRLRLGNEGNVDVGPDTLVTWRPPAGDDNIPPQLELSQGEITVNHPSGGGNRQEELPGYGGLEVTTHHTRISPEGTIYTVSTDEQGTYVRVLEGSVKLTGDMLAYTDEKYSLPGKTAFRRELTLEAGQYGRAFANPFQSSGFYGRPGKGTSEGDTDDLSTQWTWTDVERQINPTAKPKPSNPQSWADVTRVLMEQHDQEGTGVGKAPVPQSIAEIRSITDSAERDTLFNEFLSGASAWQDQEVQLLIDQWLESAIPEFASKDPTARYEAWGRIIGRGITVAGKPDIDEPRHAYLWRNSDKFTSLNLCTMRVYVERTLKGESLDDCRVETAGITEGQTERMPTKAIQSLADIPASRWTNGKPDLLDRIIVVIFGSAAAINGAEQAEKDFNKYREYGVGEVDVQYIALDSGVKKAAASLAQAAGLTFPVAKGVTSGVLKDFDQLGMYHMYVFDHLGNLLLRRKVYPDTPSENRDLHDQILKAIFSKHNGNKGG